MSLQEQLSTCVRVLVYHINLFWYIDIMEAYMLIRCEEGCERKVIEKMNEIEGIIDYQETIGTFDIIAKIECRGDGLISKVLRLPEVRKVTSLTTCAAQATVIAT
ncbi:MAG: hypothetical protein KGI25_04965 [Thaumarchaeota archaeon]|nr:hypothetical protein [Nitrososphaerota archaeon]